MTRVSSCLRLASAIAAAALLHPASAWSGEATTRPSPVCSTPPDCTQDVIYTAARGERNQVEIREDAGQVVIRDSGAPITAGTGCTTTAPGEVRCQTSNSSGISRGLVYVSTSDLDDTVTAISSVFQVEGGTGDDALTGSPEGLELLDGGPGDDRLDGGGGADDVASYESRSAGIVASLRRRSGGARGERDVYVGLSGVIGGSGGDVIEGDAAGNELSGGKGNDRISGGGGVNQIDGGPGNDTLTGGPRRDVLVGNDGADTIRAQAGGDRLVGGRGNDRLHGGRDRNLSFGGAGNDFLDLVNARREQGSCGAGRDRALVDRIDRVRACESVTRR